ncbi:MAG: hypothetical protein IH935_11330 [Acidobacteria bacterium]|nr:hypothetical protein [Acidobacteriota bacterium]
MLTNLTVRNFKSFDEVNIELGDPVVFIAYAARVSSGHIAAGAECQDVRYFPLDALPPLAFAHDPAILQAWQAMQ